MIKITKSEKNRICSNCLKIAGIKIIITKKNEGLTNTTSTYLCESCGYILKLSIKDFLLKM